MSGFRNFGAGFLLACAASVCAHQRWLGLSVLAGLLSLGAFLSAAVAEGVRDCLQILQVESQQRRALRPGDIKGHQE